MCYNLVTRILHSTLHLWLLSNDQVYCICHYFWCESDAFVIFLIRVLLVFFLFCILVFFLHAKSLFDLKKLVNYARTELSNIRIIINDYYFEKKSCVFECPWNVVRVMAQEHQTSLIWSKANSNIQILITTKKQNKNETEIIPPTTY